eukprot:TRINITY_DN45816_c0_g1_i1.p1 TRINITY_DN45816_c0_g1~~TRINITY_DN45816_c0_g1_i1.p1  ORF type:complete len:446 (+),score=85.33 TRINITY_DN45816_c0_g1_i1:69-1406(+)
MMGFGQQGMTQSRDCAVKACTIWGVDIRVSYFVLGYLGYQLYTAFARNQNSDGMLLVLGLASALVQFLLLYLTVLVHEFGHGTMARRLGGEIDHILLWPFGGICFSTRPEERDPRTLVKNDFKVVAAGPATHLPQTGLWLLCSVVLVMALNALTSCSEHTTPGLTFHDGGWWADGPVHAGCFPCKGLDCVTVFINPLSPAATYAPYLQRHSQFLYFLYCIPAMAIQLNIMLFAFNVFVPMFPADGAKLLTAALMHCCHVRPYRAAAVLIACSGSSAMLLIAWAVYSFKEGLGRAFGGGGLGPGGGLSAGALGAFSGALPGLLGLMALQETWTIYDLRRRHQLSSHPYFRAARTDIVRGVDAHGAVARLNVSGRDNPNQAFGNTSGIEASSGCMLCRCLNCWRGSSSGAAREVTLETEEWQRPVDTEDARRGRADRSHFLDLLERR